MSNLETIRDIKDCKVLPKIVKNDILKRINDWLSSGGSEHDSYISKQIRYANLVVSLEKSCSK